MSKNSYELSRCWFNFCFENPEKIKPNHTSMYFFAIEHCNRLGWKDKFGFPSTMVMEAIGIKSYNTYINTLNDLIAFGFIKLIEKSKNQYSSNIIALSNFNKATNKALDKALIKHNIKQSESTIQSIDSIIKQITNKQYNNKQVTRLKIFIEEFLKPEDKSIPTFEIFKSYALEKDSSLNIQALKLKYEAWKVNDWKDGNDKVIKNWKSKLLNTIPHLEKNIDKLNGQKQVYTPLPNKIK